MSHLPFSDPNVAASTLSNFVIYKKNVSISALADLLLFTTEENMGQFVATQVWVHINDNAGSDTRTFTATVGHNASTYDNIATSGTTSVFGGAAATDYNVKNNKAVLMPGRIASSYYNTATPANVATPVYMKITSAVSPAATITATVYVVGFYTGMRP